MATSHGEVLVKRPRGIKRLGEVEGRAQARISTMLPQLRLSCINSRTFDTATPRHERVAGVTMSRKVNTETPREDNDDTTSCREIPFESRYSTVGPDRAAPWLLYQEVVEARRSVAEATVRKQFQTCLLTKTHCFASNSLRCTLNLPSSEILAADTAAMMKS